MGLQSVPNSYSLPLISPHTFPCSSVGSSHGLRLFLQDMSTCCDESGYLEHLLHAISPSWGCRGIPSRNFPPLSTWDCRAVSHTVPLRPGCLAVFCLHLLIRALWRDCWSWLEPAVSAPTQGPPLLPSLSQYQNLAT